LKILDVIDAEPRPSRHRRHRGCAPGGRTSPRRPVGIV